MQGREKTKQKTPSLVELGELLGVHRAEGLLRERAEEEVALERAALATLPVVYEARARRFDGLSEARKWFGRRQIFGGRGGGDVLRGVGHWPGIFQCRGRRGQMSRGTKQNGGEKSTCALTSSSPSFIRQRHHAFAAH